MVFNPSYLSQLSYPVKHFLFSNDDNKKKYFRSMIILIYYAH